MPKITNYMKAATFGNRSGLIGQVLQYQNTKEIRKGLETIEVEKSKYKDTQYYTQTQNKNESKLALLMLSYIYSQDDQAISSSEKRNIVKLLKKQTQFSSKDVEEILSFLDNLPTIADVIHYISNNDITEKTFDNAYTNVYKHMKHNKVYDNLLRSLKQAYRK